MADKPAPTSGTPAPAAPSAEGGDAAAVPRRPPGHRSADMRDTVAELAERAQIISQEAGSKVAAAMKDVISAAAGIAGFAIESARDLVQYMVRRGQMTPEEGEKLIREAEAAHAKRPASEKSRPTATKIAADRAATAKAEAAARAAAQLAAAPPRMPMRPAPPPPAPSNNAHRAPAAAPVKAAPAAHTKPAEKKAAAPKAPPAKPVKAAKPPKPAKSPSVKASKPGNTAKKRK
jgi:polyhydroxyalkanoate synthesis regulator phasin